MKELLASVILAAAPTPESLNRFDPPYVVCDTEQQIRDVVADSSKLLTYYNLKNDMNEPTCVVVYFPMYAHVHDVHYLESTKEGYKLYAIKIGEGARTGWLLFTEVVKSEDL